MPSSVRRNSPLTDIQTRVYRVVCQYIDKHDYPPSIPDVARLAEVPLSTAQSALAALERKGFVYRIPGVARGLRVLKRPAKRAK